MGPKCLNWTSPLIQKNSITSYRIYNGFQTKISRYISKFQVIRLLTFSQKAYSIKHFYNGSHPIRQPFHTTAPIFNRLLYFLSAQNDVELWRIEDSEGFSFSWHIPINKFPLVLHGHSHSLWKNKLLSFIVPHKNSSIIFVSDIDIPNLYLQVCTAASCSYLSLSFRQLLGGKRASMTTDNMSLLTISSD